jgi:membrane protein involved in D-alanine export
MIDFYTSPLFYLLLAVAVLPAAILGLSGRRIRHYGFVVSLLFMALLFGERLPKLLGFLLFLVIASSATLVLMREWRLGGAGGKQRIWVYRLSLAATVAPLIVCKLGAVFDEDILGFIGISYLTFKALQVLIEIRDGLIEHLSPLEYLYFLLFFAPFTSGPIDRSRRFAQDANRRFTREEYAGLLARGILLLLLGAVYKLVFSAVALLNYTPEALVPGFGIVEVAKAVKDAWAYGVHLFFDFAGYSLMAIGAGCCFGIITPPNFKAPFAARDIKDFWNRWHMTLSFWLRDFVFMRFTRFALKHQLLGSRQTIACTAYLLNMILMGAWHGLNVNYLMYGLFHGFLLAATDVYQKRSRFYQRYKDTRPYQLASWALTLNLVMFGFALFSGQVQLIVGGFLNE